ncbi:MAG: MFS transporter [Microcella sp.]|uniref:MFS transporter n=1 Tax=Microcella sp. TaxID=1913979 RepID=UPI00331524AE
MVVGAGIVSALTAPGQTAGLSPLVDPLIRTLDITRTEISTAYLIGTLVGAGALPFIGRALDRWGARSVMLIVGSVFALLLAAASFAADILGLTGAFAGLRMAGQGALSLAAVTIVARTVFHRSGLALGITSAIGSAGISLAPLGVERLVAATDVPTTWRVESLVVLAIVVPIALLLPKDSPVRGTSRPHPESADDGWELREALRTGMFWVLTAAIFCTGMLSTALAFHQISILGQQGFSTLEAAANFLPQTITALLATLGVGALADRIDPRWGVVFSMAMMAGTLLFLPFVASGFLGIVYGLLLGAAGGGLRGIEAAAFVRYFGRRRIGTIRGVATSIGLASTALGPVVFALGFAATGSYLETVLVSALLPLAILVAAIVVRAPVRSSALSD